MTTCLFCALPPVAHGKCAVHRHRVRCHAPGCLNQSYARGLCVFHGGKAQCQVDGCTANARRFGRCSKHSPANRHQVTCDVPFCAKVVHSGKRCVVHGGSRQCKRDGCLKYARTDGLCVLHRREATHGPLPEHELAAAVDIAMDEVEGLINTIDGEWMGWPCIQRSDEPALKSEWLAMLVIDDVEEFIAI
ncbi:Aste57867_1710 [Aphanomyces stellatus]|uniref:Aste57867_1710 protein n=1 Tax=Aphanomyces stellatus TaxID=120398 RepID=A0A485K5R5_9STRA|nr:hypothetical protein As57867_001708 [Aphanomyces stellatus]VFT78921.1 Aste57867_1710 [Aphanomyces stellatus]